VLEARGHLALATGDPGSALGHYEASGRHLANAFFIDAPTIITWRSNAAFAICAQNGDLRRARTLAEEELAQARSMGAPRQQARALRAAAAARPGTAKAVRLLREAHAITAAAGPRLEHLHVLTDLGLALIATDNPIAAREPLQEALEASEISGAGAVAARARSLLRATGIRPRRTARTGAGVLTPTELHIATLAASGHGNRSIAQILTISERTVESHLYNTFTKLRIHRREQLALHLPQEPAE
jgi:DNA-binding CsgD family transcriptional regulator